MPRLWSPPVEDDEEVSVLDRLRSWRMSEIQDRNDNPLPSKPENLTYDPLSSIQPPARPPALEYDPLSSVREPQYPKLKDWLAPKNELSVSVPESDRPYTGPSPMDYTRPLENPEERELPAQGRTPSLDYESLADILRPPVTDQLMPKKSTAHWSAPNLSDTLRSVFGPQAAPAPTTERTSPTRTIDIGPQLTDDVDMSGPQRWNPIGTLGEIGDYLADTPASQYYLQGLRDRSESVQGVGPKSIPERILAGLRPLNQPGVGASDLVTYGAAVANPPMALATLSARQVLGGMIEHTPLTAPSNAFWDYITQGAVTGQDVLADTGMAVAEGLWDFPTRLIFGMPLDEIINLTRGMIERDDDGNVMPGQWLSLGQLAAPVGDTAWNAALAAFGLPNKLPEVTNAIAEPEFGYFGDPNNLGNRAAAYLTQLYQDSLAWNESVRSMPPEERAAANFARANTYSGPVRVDDLSRAIIKRDSEVARLERLAYEADAGGAPVDGAVLRLRARELKQKSYREIMDENYVHIGAELAFGLIDPTDLLIGPLVDLAGVGPTAARQGNRLFLNWTEADSAAVLTNVNQTLQDVIQAATGTEANKLIAEAFGKDATGNRGFWDLSWLPGFKRTPESNATIDTNYILQGLRSIFAPAYTVGDGQYLMDVLLNRPQELVTGIDPRKVSPEMYAAMVAGDGPIKYGPGMANPVWTQRYPILGKAADKFGELKSLYGSRGYPLDPNDTLDWNALWADLSYTVWGATSEYHGVKPRGVVGKAVQVPANVLRDWMTHWFLSTPRNAIRNALGALGMALGVKGFTFTPNAVIESDLTKMYGRAPNIRLEETYSGLKVGTLPANAYQEIGGAGWTARLLDKIPILNYPLSKAPQWMINRVAYGDAEIPLGPAAAFPVGEQSNYQHIYYQGVMEALPPKWREAIDGWFIPTLINGGFSPAQAQAIGGTAQVQGAFSNPASLGQWARSFVGQPTIPSSSITSLNIPTSLVPADVQRTINDLVNRYAGQNVDGDTIKAVQQEAANYLETVKDYWTRVYGNTPPEPGDYQTTAEAAQEAAVEVEGVLANLAAAAGIDPAAAKTQAAEMAGRYYSTYTLAIDTFWQELAKAPNLPATWGAVADFYMDLYGAKLTARGQADALMNNAVVANTPEAWSTAWDAVPKLYDALMQEYTRLGTDWSQKLIDIQNGLDYVPQNGWAEMLRRYIDWDEAAYQTLREDSKALGSPANTGQAKLFTDIRDANRERVDNAFALLQEAFVKFPTLDNFDTLMAALHDIDSLGREAAGHLAEMRAKAFDGELPWSQYYIERWKTWNELFTDAAVERLDAWTHVLVGRSLGETLTWTEGSNTWRVTEKIGDDLYLARNQNGDIERFKAGATATPFTIPQNIVDEYNRFITEGDSIIESFLSTIQAAVTPPARGYQAGTPPPLLDETSAYEAFRRFFGASSDEEFDSVWALYKARAQRWAADTGQAADDWFQFLAPPERRATPPVDATARYSYAENYGGRPFPTMDEFKTRLEEVGLITPQEARAFLGEFPEYLNEVGQFLIEQRDKFNNGLMTARDIAKAYVMTVASQGADAARVSLLTPKWEAAGVDFGDVDLARYGYPLKSGEIGIRPEDAMGAWLLGPQGKLALDELENGTYRADLWALAEEVRKAYGGSRFQMYNIFGEPKPGTFNMTSLDFLNSLGQLSSVEELTAALSRLNGVSTGKVPFLKHMLGFGDTPTLDVREMTFWLTGQGDVPGLTRYARGDTTPAEDLAQLASASRRSDAQLPNYTTGAPMQAFADMVKTRMDDLYNLGILPEEISPDIAYHVLHHWLWDKIKGLQTGVNDIAVYPAMRFATTIGDQPLASVGIAEDGRALLHAYTDSLGLKEFVHETAHIFHFDLQRTGEVSPAAKADYEKLVKWADPKADPNQPLSREAAERIADGFTAYVRSGKAPSQDLVSVFRRLRQWLVDLYKSIKESGLPVVNKALREVFDNMLATEDQQAVRANRLASPERVGQVPPAQSAADEIVAPGVAGDEGTLFGMDEYLPLLGGEAYPPGAGPARTPRPRGPARPTTQAFSGPLPPTPSENTIRGLAAQAGIESATKEGRPVDNYLLNWVRKHTGIDLQRLGDATPQERWMIWIGIKERLGELPGADELRALIGNLQQGQLFETTDLTPLFSGEAYAPFYGGKSKGRAGRRIPGLRSGEQIAKDEERAFRKGVEKRQFAGQWFEIANYADIPEWLGKVMDEIDGLGDELNMYRQAWDRYVASGYGVPSFDKMRFISGKTDETEYIFRKLEDTFGTQLGPFFWNNDADVYKLFERADQIIAKRARLRDLIDKESEFAGMSIGQIIAAVRDELEAAGMDMESIARLGQASRREVLDWVQSIRGQSPVEVVGMEAHGEGPAILNQRYFTHGPAPAGQGRPRPLWWDLLRTYVNNRATGGPNPNAGSVAGQSISQMNVYANRVNSWIASALQGTPNTMTNAQRQTFLQAVDQLSVRLQDILKYAAWVGEKKADWAMLNFGDRRFVDTFLQSFIPYHYFQSRMPWRVARSVGTNPYLGNLLFEIERSVDLENKQSGAEGTRLEGTVPNPLYGPWDTPKAIAGAKLGPLQVPDEFTVLSPRMRVNALQLLPWSLYVQPNMFIDPLEAESSFERAYLRYKSWAPSPFLPYEIGIAAIMDQVWPREDGTKRVAENQLQDMLPLPLASAVAAFTGVMPSSGVLGSDEFDPYRAMRELAIQKIDEGVPPDKVDTVGMFAHQVINNMATGKPLGEGIPPEYFPEALAWAQEAVKGSSRETLTNRVTSILTGMPGAGMTDTEAEMRAQSADYSQLGYNPYTNPTGSKEVKAKFREQNPYLPFWWAKNAGIPGSQQEDPATRGRRNLMYQQQEPILEGMQATTEAALAENPNLTRQEKYELEQPYWEDYGKVRSGLEKYGPIPKITPSTRGANPTELAQMQIDRMREHAANYPGKPDYFKDGATPEEKVAYYRAKAKWEVDRMRWLDRQLRQLTLSEDPYAEDVNAAARQLLGGQYTADILRQYEDRYAGPLEMEWSRRLQLADEVASYRRKGSEAAVKRYLGDETVGMYQIYLQTPPEGRQALRDQDWRYGAALEAAIHPNEYGEATRLFGKDWYQAYATRPKWPAGPNGEEPSDEEKEAYYAAYNDHRRKYPHLDHIALWYNGRTKADEIYKTLSEGIGHTPRDYGKDYREAVLLFGNDILDVEAQYLAMDKAGRKAWRQAHEGTYTKLQEYWAWSDDLKEATYFEGYDVPEDAAAAARKGYYADRDRPPAPTATLESYQGPRPYGTDAVPVAGPEAPSAPSEFPTLAPQGQPLPQRPLGPEYDPLSSIMPPMPADVPPDELAGIQTEPGIPPRPVTPPLPGDVPTADILRPTYKMSTTPGTAPGDSTVAPLDAAFPKLTADQTPWITAEKKKLGEKVDESNAEYKKKYGGGGDSALDSKGRPRTDSNGRPWSEYWDEYFALETGAEKAEYLRNHPEFAAYYKQYYSEGEDWWTEYGKNKDGTSSGYSRSSYSYGGGGGGFDFDPNAEYNQDAYVRFAESDPSLMPLARNLRAWRALESNLGWMNVGRGLRPEGQAFRPSLP